MLEKKDLKGFLFVVAGVVAGNAIYGIAMRVINKRTTAAPTAVPAETK